MVNFTADENTATRQQAMHAYARRPSDAHLTRVGGSSWTDSVAELA